MKISVVIPNYNYGRFLAQAIESSMAADEVIVVDDGSSDGSPKVAENYPVKLIRQPNAGVAAARNRGITEATGEAIAFLDADDFFYPGAIETYRREFAPEIDILVAGKRRVHGERSLGDDFPSRLGWIARETPVNFSGSVFCARKEVFNIHKFDEERLLHPSEDWEFIYRASNTHRIKPIHEILACYRIHGDNVHLTLKNTERSMLLAFERVFRNGEPRRRESYATLHSILAGSYLSARDYSQFVKHGIKSVAYHPKVILKKLLKIG